VITQPRRHSKATQPNAHEAPQPSRLQKDKSANAAAIGFSKFPGNKYQHNAAHAAGYTEQYVLNASQPAMLPGATGI
jgi:hypothetical protein